MLSCTRCGREGCSLVGGGEMPGTLCLRCVGALGIKLRWGKRQRRRQTFSVAPKRRAYVYAGAPYGRNRKGLKRWLREVKADGPRNPYAYVQIPVMLACNDDRGDFDGNIRMVDIHDSLQLESIFIDEETFDPAGVECSLSSVDGEPCIVIGAEAFPYINRLSWCGNMCWELFVMYGADCLRFLNRLLKEKVYGCTSGESRLFNHWDAGREFTEKELALIHKFSLDFRL